MNRPHRHLALLLGGLGLLLIVFVAPSAVEPPAPTAPRPPVASTPAVAATPAAAGKTALAKEANKALSRTKAPITAAPAAGTGDARFILRDRTASAFFTPRGVSLALMGRMQGRRPDPTRPGWGLHWGIVGAAAVEPRPEGELPSKVHVLKGKPEDWKVDQAVYSRVVYEGVKPGVDMVVDAASHGVKYSLLAAKAADVAALRFRYEGASSLRVDENGKALEIGAGEGTIREDGLVVTQDGRPVEASYRATGPDEYAIVLDGADPSKPLEVDPQIGWSTYLGGTLSNGGGSEYGYTVKVDAAGSMYLAGTTNSGDFPGVGGNFDSSLGGYQDGFVLKLNSSGAVVWSTYLGGSSYEEIRGLALDGASPPNVYVTGYTDSSDFPIVGSVVDSTFVNSEVFVTRINGNGAAVPWSTFLGGTSSEYGRAIAVDGTGANVWVAGYTYSSDFPTFAGFDNSASTVPDGFVAKLSVAAGPVVSFVYSSYVGGSSSDYVQAMAVDASGAAYLTGYTYSTDLPLAGTPYRNFNSGGADVFVVKVKPAATALDWGTYIGGASEDVANAIAIDGSGNSYVTGYSFSLNYPTTTSMSVNNGSADTILTKLNPAGSALVYSSYHGGSDYDVAYGVVLNAAGEAITTGLSYSISIQNGGTFQIGNFPPYPSPYSTSNSGSADIFVTGWNAAPAGGAFPLIWSTFIGGSSYDVPYAMAIDASGSVYLTGETSSPPSGGPSAFPLSSAPNPPPFDSTLGSYEDSFILRLSTANGSPVGLTYGSYVGGANSVGDDYGRRVAADATGALYVTGVTYASNFPTTGGAFQTAVAATPDITVTKYSNAAAPAIVWSTYLGGNSYEEPTGIGVDPSVSPNPPVYVVGYTSSNNFPTLPLGFMSGFTDSFVTKLLPNGNGLAWSRFLGGSNDDYAFALDVNADGDVAVTGYTYSGDFPTFAMAPPVFQSFPTSLPDAFVTVIPANGAGFTYSTYIGGSSSEYPNAVAFDSTGKLVVVAGTTYSNDFPLAGTPTQAFNAGNADLFVARFDPELIGASQLQFSTYYGSFDYDYLQDMDVGPGDNMFLLADVYHPFFPTTTGPPHAGSDDAAIVKIRTDGALLWSRHLGGSNTDYPSRLRVDAGGSAIVTGYTYSINFPVQGAFQPSPAGAADVFITKIDNSGDTLDWSSYLGGSNSDYPYGLAVFDGGTVFVIGETYSSNFPTPNGNDTVAQGAEFFVTRIDNSNPSSPSSLAQFKSNGTTGMSVGAWSNEASFVVKGNLGDLDDDGVALQVEIQPIDVAFTGAVSATSGFVNSGTQAAVSVNFPGGTQQFHWRARTIDIHSRTSAWVVFGGNSDGAPPGIPAARDVGRDVGVPSISTSSPTSGSTYTTAITPISFVGAASDTLSGIASVGWTNSLGGFGTATLNSPSPGQWTVPSIALSSSSGGINVITFTATDQAGNSNTKVVTVTYDTTAPVNTITSPTAAATYLTGTGSPPGGPATGTITLGGTVNEANTLPSVQWVNASGGSGAATIGGSAPNWTWSATVTLTPGSNAITVTAYDGANNQHADAITVTYDNVSPAVNITTAPFTTASATLPVNLVGTASDANGIASVTWSNPAALDSGSATLNSPGPGQWTVPTPDIALAAGANVITVTANDGVVNQRSTLNSASTSITIYRDVANPVLTIVNPAPPTFTTGNASVLITGTATDDLNVASVTYVNSLGGSGSATLSGPVTSRSWSATVALTLGTNTVTFTATDGVGQIHAGAIDVIYSTTVPSVVVTDPATTTSVTATSPIVVSGTATAESPKTITGLTVRNLTTGVFSTVTGTLPNWDASVALVIGTNNVRIIATDSGALQTTVDIVVILDPTDPTVTITGPTGADTYASPANSVTLSGVASDNRAVASVQWNNFTTMSGDQSATVSGPPASVTWTTSAIPLNLGANIIRIRATDEAGLITDDTITVTYDTTVPGITITSPTSASSTTTLLNSVTLGGTASDNIDLQVITWLNAATGASGTATGTGSWTTPAVSLSAGTNVITVIAVDTAGNTSTDTLTVYLDGATPAVAITSPTSDPTLDTATAAISLGGTASDDVQVAAVTWLRNPGGLTGTATGTTTWSIDSIPLVAGTNTITVTATDGASQSANDVLTVVYDPTAPTVAISTPATDPFSTTVTPLSLAGTASDNIAVTEVAWANLTTGGSGSASGTDSWTCLAPLTSGSNLITVTSRDAAGNTATATVTVVYDPAAPIIAITSPTMAISIATNSTPLVIGGTASDDVGVASVTWSTSGAVVPNSGTATGTDAWSFSVALSPGDNVITVVAADNVGRTGTTFLTVVYDPTLPTVTILSPTSDSFYRITQPTVTLSGVANDNLSLQGVTWTNAATAAGGATSGVGAWSIPNAALVEGPNLFTITATDGVNNAGMATITVSFDGTDPLLTIDPPNPLLATFNGTQWDTATRPFPLTGTASDNIGLTGVTWVNTTTGLPGAPVLGSGSAVLTPDGGGGFTWSAPINFVAGINTITLTATDDHGRTATAQIAFNFTPEGTAPLISILTPAPPTALSATQVASLTGNSTDNVGVVAVTWRNTTTRIRGDAVPTGPGGVGPPPDFSTWSADIPLTRGANVIVVTAVDDAGNTATAGITVTYSPAGTDTTDPVVTIQLPSNTGSFAAASSPITLSADASDVGDGVAAVTWTNTGTTGAGGLSPGAAPAWTGSIALALGTNVIKVTVADASGNTASDTIVVTFAPAAPDGNPPTITIQTPPPAVQYATSVGSVTVTGIASDATAVATVVFLNGATSETGSADGTTSWTADVTLQSGINLLTFTVYDVYGFTQTTQLTAVYTPPPPPPEIVPAGSCGLLGLDALMLLAALAALRRARRREEGD